MNPTTAGWLKYSADTHARTAITPVKLGLVLTSNVGQSRQRSKPTFRRRRKPLPVTCDRWTHAYTAEGARRRDAWFMRHRVDLLLARRPAQHEKFSTCEKIQTYTPRLPCKQLEKCPRGQPLSKHKAPRLVNNAGGVFRRKVTATGRFRCGFRFW